MELFVGSFLPLSKICLYFVFICCILFNTVILFKRLRKIFKDLKGADFFYIVFVLIPKWELHIFVFVLICIFKFALTKC